MTHHPASSAGKTRSGVNPWFVFFLICVPILIGSVDLTAIVVILPQATLDLLGPQGLGRANDALWAVTAYLLAYTISLALVGRLSDVLPRKQVFVACIVIFILGALWAGTATDFPLQVLRTIPIWPEPEMLPLISLVIGRVIQAIGAGASVSVGMALVSDIFPPEKRAEPISLIGAVDSLGWVVGNLYAGLMLQVLPSWKTLFLINAGIAILALGLTILALRRGTGYEGMPTIGGKFDRRGAILFALMLMALTIGVEALNHQSTLTLGLLISSVPLFVVFVWSQIKAKNPLFDPDFIRQREVRAALITNLIVGFGLILIVAGVPLAINLRTIFLRGEGLLIGALRAGIMLCALTIPLVVAVLAGEDRYRKVGAGIPVAVGLAMAIIGFLGASTWTYMAPSPIIAIPLALIGTGLGLTIGPLSLVVIDAAEESARGLASSLVLVMRLLGMTIGTPLAASVTLTLANQWASEQAALTTLDFQTVARTMLIPPLTIEALTRIMIAGAVMCGIGLVVFYLRRAYATVRELNWKSPPLPLILNRLPGLALVIALVFGAALIDNATTPTVLPNPIARQLPPNVELYAGFNIQQAFLVNGKEPLDLVVDMVRVMSGYRDGTVQVTSTPEPTPTVAPTDTPIAPTPAPTGSATETAATPMLTPEITPTPQPAQPEQPEEDFEIGPTGESASDTLVKLLFRPLTWRQINYRAFCTSQVPDDNMWWQHCFNQSIGGWIGPQAAFALLPRTREGYDFLFVFQATNRNNAISFALNLGIALGDQTLRDAPGNVRLLDINAGTVAARQLAITDAYVVIGTPRAVHYMLNHGSVSLADQPGYQAITAQLPSDNFATIYYRAGDFETELKPALASLFDSPVVDAFTRALGQLSPLSLIRTTNAPTLVGLTLRVNEKQLVLDAVASLPFSLQKLNTAPVSTDLITRIPGNANGWFVTNLNIAGIARDLSISDALSAIGREAGTSIVGTLISNPLTQAALTTFAQSIQNILTQATGPLILAAMPGEDGRAFKGAVLLPLDDREGRKAADAVAALRAQLQLVAGLSGGALNVSARDGGPTGSVISIGGPAIGLTFPDGIHLALMPDNMLIITLGETIEGYQASLATAGRLPDLLRSSLIGNDERFMYAYVTPPKRWQNPLILVGGEIKFQTLHINAVLQTKRD